MPQMVGSHAPEKLSPRPPTCEALIAHHMTRQMATPIVVSLNKGAEDEEGPYMPPFLGEPRGVASGNRCSELAFSRKIWEPIILALGAVMSSIENEEFCRWRGWVGVWKHAVLQGRL